MSDSFYHITESSELNGKIRVQNILHFCHVGQPYFRIFTNLISHVCETRKFVMAILHRKQGFLCGKNPFWHTCIYAGFQYFSFTNILFLRAVLLVLSTFNIPNKNNQLRIERYQQNIIKLEINKSKWDLCMQSV